MSEIRFMLDDATEILRLSKDGIWVNPAYPVEETAQRVLDALSANVRVMVEKAVEAEREACAKMCIRLCDQVDYVGADECIDAIKEHFGVEK